MAGFTGTQFDDMQAGLFKHTFLFGRRNRTGGFHFQADIRLVGFHQNTKRGILRHIFGHGNHFVVAGSLFYKLQPAQFIRIGGTVRFFQERQPDLAIPLHRGGQRNIEVCDIGGAVKDIPLKNSLAIKFKLPHRPASGCQVATDPVIIIVRLPGELGKRNRTNRLLVLRQTGSFHPAFAAETGAANTEESTGYILRQGEGLRHRLIFSRTGRNRHIKQRVRLVVNIVGSPSRLPVEQLDRDAEITVRREGQVLFLYNRKCNCQLARLQQFAGNTVIGMTLERIVFTFEVK